MARQLLRGLGCDRRARRLRREGEQKQEWKPSEALSWVLLGCSRTLLISRMRRVRLATLGAHRRIRPSAHLSNSVFTLSLVRFAWKRLERDEALMRDPRP
jgi:hypothetical protein